MNASANSSTVVMEAPVVPQFLADLEATIAEHMCMLLDILSPEQFELVQDVHQATQALTVARISLAERRGWGRRPSPSAA